MPPPLADDGVASFGTKEELAMNKACSAGLALTAARCAGRLSAQERLPLPAPLPEPPAQASPLQPVGTPAPVEAAGGLNFLEMWDHANGWLSVTPANLWPRHDMGLHASLFRYSALYTS